MLSPNGDKTAARVILTESTIDYLDRQAAKLSISRSAYIRMLIVKDMEAHEQPPEKGQIQP